MAMNDCRSHDINDLVAQSDTQRVQWMLGGTTEMMRGRSRMDTLTHTLDSVHTEGVPTAYSDVQMSSLLWRRWRNTLYGIQRPTMHNALKCHGDDLLEERGTSHTSSAAFVYEQRRQVARTREHYARFLRARLDGTDMYGGGGILNSVMESTHTNRKGLQTHSPGYLTRLHSVRNEQESPIETHPTVQRCDSHGLDVNSIDCTAKKLCRDTNNYSTLHHDTDPIYPMNSNNLFTHQDHDISSSGILWFFNMMTESVFVVVTISLLGIWCMEGSMTLLHLHAGLRLSVYVIIVCWCLPVNFPDLAQGLPSSGPTNEDNEFRMDTLMYLDNHIQVNRSAFSIQPLHIDRTRSVIVDETKWPSMRNNTWQSCEAPNSSVSVDLHSTSTNIAWHRLHIGIRSVAQPVSPETVSHTNAQPVSQDDFISLRQQNCAYLVQTHVFGIGQAVVARMPCVLQFALPIVSMISLIALIGILCVGISASDARQSMTNKNVHQSFPAIVQQWCWNFNNIVLPSVYIRGYNAVHSTLQRLGIRILDRETHVISLFWHGLWLFPLFNIVRAMCKHGVNIFGQHRKSTLVFMLHLTLVTASLASNCVFLVVCLPLRDTEQSSQWYSVKNTKLIWVALVQPILRLLIHWVNANILSYQLARYQAHDFHAKVLPAVTRKMYLLFAIPSAVLLYSTSTLDKLALYLISSLPLEMGVLLVGALWSNRAANRLTNDWHCYLIVGSNYIWITFVANFIGWSLMTHMAARWQGWYQSIIYPHWPTTDMTNGHLMVGGNSTLQVPISFGMTLGMEWNGFEKLMYLLIGSTFECWSTMLHFILARCMRFCISYDFIAIGSHDVRVLVMECIALAALAMGIYEALLCDLASRHGT
jgi:hypothetical protein